MDAPTCTAEEIQFPDGEILEAIPYGDESKNKKEEERCPSCGVEIGGYHHPGCEISECPRCGKPLASCSCLETNKQ